MTRPIFPHNDLVVGVGPLTDENGVLATGMTVTAWLSTQPDHSSDNPAPEIHADLSVELTEDGTTASYPGHIPGEKIDEHMIDAEPSFVGTDVWLHRANDTGSWTHPPERCRVYPRRYA